MVAVDGRNDRRNAVEQRVVRELGPDEFVREAVVFDRSAERVVHQLVAETDAQRRNPSFDQLANQFGFLVHPRIVVALVHAGGASGNDDAIDGRQGRLTTLRDVVVHLVVGKKRLHRTDEVAVVRVHLVFEDEQHREGSVRDG